MLVQYMAMAQFNPSPRNPPSSEPTRETTRNESPAAAHEERATSRAAIDSLTLLKPGTGKGIWMAADFDEPLDDFRDYL